MVAEAPAELMLKHMLGCNVLRPVRADQSEQTGLLYEGGLKETGA